MKFLVAFMLALTTASAFDLGSDVIENTNVAVPVEETEGRIHNGHNAAVGQFPYQVGLSKNVGNKYFWCGGSLIGNQWVLTAAHCTDGVKSVIVFLGSNYRWQGQVIHTVTPKDIIIHYAWNSNTTRNDISLIKIPFTAYTSLIQPVKLPVLSYFPSTYDGEIVVASGWGITGDANDFANYLQWGRMRVITNSACARYFNGIEESNICVSTPGGVSTCPGDSGGPLVLDSSKLLVGFTSFGSVSCSKGYPAVFTRVTFYLRWIEAYTGIVYNA